MRALVPLPALLLLAASAAACPFGSPGHVHPSAAQAAAAAAASPIPEGKCAGRGPAPAAQPVPTGGPPYDLKTSPIPDEHRVYWEMIGYRIDDENGRLLNSGGAAVSSAEIIALQRPFDASYEHLNTSLWGGLMFNGYRLDEGTCRLIGPDAKPLNSFQMKIWDAQNRRGENYGALENLLVKLRYLNPARPVPEDVRREMLALAQAGTELPPKIKALLARNGTTVGELKGPTAASYADATKFYDGQRPLGDVVAAALPDGDEPGVAARRKGIADPDERILGAMMSKAFNAEMSKTEPGRELLSHFRGPKGENMPDVMVLKLAQNPNDPNQMNAMYYSSADRIVINHWRIVSVLHARLPPDKIAKIEGRLNDAKQLSKLLAEDSSLLPLIVDNIDVEYFHELTHAAQSRRNRFDDEMLRGNLPISDPLAKEHEAHRSHCRYLLSKGPAAVDRSDWRDYCLGMIRDPKGFEEAVTRRYLSTFSGSSKLDDIATRQRVRREAARTLASQGGIMDWAKQKLKQFGYDLGDKELAKYETDVDKREREFLAGVPQLRNEAGGALIDYYVKTGAENRALALVVNLPGFDDSPALIKTLAAKTTAWVTRSKDPAQRGERLAAVNAIVTKAGGWTAALRGVYDRDARSVAEELLAAALKAPPDERDHLLDQAKAWAKSIPKPGNLPMRIEKARARIKPK